MRSLGCLLAVTSLLALIGCAAPQLYVRSVVFDGAAPDEFTEKDLVSAKRPLGVPVAGGKLRVDPPLRAERIRFEIKGESFEAVVGRNDGDDYAEVSIDPDANPPVRLSRGFIEYLMGRWPISSTGRISLSTPNLVPASSSPQPAPGLQVELDAFDADRAFLVRADFPAGAAASSVLLSQTLTKANTVVECYLLGFPASPKSVTLAGTDKASRRIAYIQSIVGSFHP